MIITKKERRLRRAVKARARIRDLGIARVVAGLPPEPADKILPMLDNWVEIMRQVQR